MRPGADVDARVEAVRRRGIRRAARDVPSLVAGLSDDAAAVRAMACRALGWQRSPAVADPLLTILDDAEPTVRREAIKSLALCFPRGASLPDCAERALVARMGDDDADVRAAAARVCGWLGLTSAVGEIRRLLTGDAVDDVRAEAAHAVGRLGDMAAVPALQLALGAAHGGLRHQAARALGVLGAEGALDALVSRLGDADPEVRVAALRAVVGLTDDIEPALVALTDENPGVRCTAAILAGRHRRTPISTLDAALRTEVHPEARSHLQRALAARQAEEAG